jgi:hypothetical protein
MAMWRGVGGLTFIVAGATHYWEYSYSPFSDVGPTVASPNILQDQINVELATSHPGVTGRDGGEATRIVYTVRVTNLGAATIGYDLNIGDWQ